ncbi:MAG: isoleucine--tRNA ligase [Planctomycetota bacterium]
MFQPVDGSPSFPKLEEEVLAFWREQGIYQKSLDQRDGAEPFVFYEGPPTANGMPHPGHCLTRTIKDVFPRYKTMRGYRCERKAGWDTHGLPVEVEVCKELGIHSKEEIEAYGVEPFIQKCQASVWRYMQEWEQLTERLGFWVNLKEAYVTYHQSYVESVWWSLKHLFDRGLLYQGHKIVWWWAQGGTALSSGEVGQGYREVDDPSVYVKFPLVDEEGAEVGVSLLVWTTTPWTLPSNQFVAINPELTYCNIFDEEAKETYIVAADLVETLAEKSKRSLQVTGNVDAKGLLNCHYKPPFACFYNDESIPAELADTYRKQSWQILTGDFVTTDSGTGLVHIAPAFGEDDYQVLDRERARVSEATGTIEAAPELINCVAADGKFTDEAPEFVRGRWVKDCDKDIARNLKERGLLFHQEQYRHDYPFCWRAEQDPLIQYPRESWFIKTTAFKEAMLQNNQAINWLPEHIKGGRMGKFLESNVDWALSRERYWGTPLPIWECSKTGKQEAIGGYEELLAKPGVQGTEVWEQAKAANPELPDDLRVHKPYIDEVTYESPFAEGARMKRVTEVIDCWYDSGAMPFAQWGHKGEPAGVSRRSETTERFANQFPADFISEALDQTRGWFYSQLAISTMLFGKGESNAPGAYASGSPAAAPPHPFRNCIVLGLMLGEDGQKMSKSKRNYREPNEIFNKYGADALRWYLLANQPPWTSIRYSEQSIKDSIPEFLLRLYNCYRFLVEYAKSDAWTPKGGVRGQGSGARDELDRWVLSELHRTIALVTDRMDAYDNFGAAGAITEFVDGLSNWWVRRSRARFWDSDKQSPAKLDAYATLYECLVETSKLIAPFTPFIAEVFWRNLGSAAAGQPESVHLCDYPVADESLIDKELSERMATVRLIASLGRRAREAASLKVRQPLAKVEVILADTTHQAWLEEHAAVIADELNVKEVAYTDEPERYVDHQVLPNFKLLGKRLGKLMPKVKHALNQQSGSELLANLRDNGLIDLEIEGEAVQLSPAEVEVRITAKPGYAAANDRGVVVVLATELTPELIAEGLARDLVRVIQDTRKDQGCEFTDRIQLGIETDSPELQAAVEQFNDYIAGETLADSLVCETVGGVAPVDIKVGGAQAKLYLRVASN